MTFKITDFASELDKKNGVLRTNRYRVIITPPAGSTGVSLFDSSIDLSFWAQEAMIPGYQLLTHDVRRYTYGTNEARPFAPNFVPLQLGFGIDGNMNTWEFFHAWMQHIMPHDVGRENSTGSIHARSAYSGSSAQAPYMLKYKNEYTTDIRLDVHRQDGTKIRTINFRQAFPININPVGLSFEENNAFGKFSVVIDYLDWYETAVANSSINNTTF